MLMLGVIWLVFLTMCEILVLRLYSNYIPKKIFSIRQKFYDLQYLKGSAYINKQDEIEKEIKGFIGLSFTLLLSIILLIILYIIIL